MQNLDKSQATTGILYDRVFPVADIERFKQINQTTDTSNPRHWLQAYYELYNSAYNNSGWQTPAALDDILNSNKLINKVPIGLLNFKYNIIDTNAYVDNLIDTLPNGQFVDVQGRPRHPYFTQGTFIAAPLISENAVFIEDEEYTFYIDPQFFASNEHGDIQQIRIDFGDGQGEWIVNNPFSEESTEGTSNFIKKYMRVGFIGRIFIVIKDIRGHTTQYGNPFQIFVKKKKDKYILSPCKGGKDGGIKWVIEPDPVKLAVINAQYGNPTALPENKQVIFQGGGYTFSVPVKDTAYFFFNGSGDCANKVVKKPVIFIDGFDPTNTRKVGDIYQDKINIRVERGGNQNILFGDYLLEKDLDFIILDFKHGNDLLERNAMVLIALIERLNSTYGSNYEQDITIIGPSMGSLIAQYALAYMEHNNIPHRVKTYISFDGCHQGSNVPIGLQHFIEYVTKRGILKGIESVREGMYNGLGAKQMLAHHHSANSETIAHHPFRTQFLQNLAAVGEYPQQCRKVAIINGTNTGALNPEHGQSTTLLDIEIMRKGWKSLWGNCNDNICKKIKWKASIAPSFGTKKVAEMWTANPLFNALFWVPLGQKNYYASAAWGNSSQDNAPGGMVGEQFSDDYNTHGTFLAKELIYLLTGSLSSFNININNFTLMPSYSSADLRFSNKNLYMKWDDQYLCGKTPFDYVYAPHVNTEHVTVSPESSHWFENEITCNKLNLPTYAKINGPDFVCNTQIYELEICKPVNLNVVWEVYPAGIVDLTSNGAQVSLTKIANGTITLIAKNNNCKEVIYAIRTLNVGATATSIIGPMDINDYSEMLIANTNTTYYFLAYETSSQIPAQSYTWTVFPPTGSPTMYSGNSPFVTFTETWYHTVQVSKMTACGPIVSTKEFLVMENMFSFSVMASPNPVINDLLNIVIDKENSQVKALPPNEEMSVELFQFNTGIKRKQWKFKNHEKQFQLNLSGIPKGKYLLKIKKGNYHQTRQIIVE